MRKRLFSILTFASVVLFLGSCSSYKNITYFQDRLVDHPEEIDQQAGILIQPKDMLSIVVSSKNPQAVAIFNLPVISYQAGSEIMASTANQRLLGYVVDNNGQIDFPVLGKIDVAGLTRWNLSEFIKNELIEKGLLLDAVVTVEFMNFKVSVMGEVNSPGTYSIDGDKVTILQALSLARDLTIFGKRENVSVIREQDGRRVIYEVNLCSVDMFKSPAYYLQQNDIVYVEPNNVKVKQSTYDDKSMRITSIALSSGSILVSIAALVVNIIGSNR
ncbi:MAG: polysaccharide biosynthesis/export family protein [Candidatus Cryptobacteroides sp.]